MGIIKTYLHLEAESIVEKPISIPFEFSNKESIPKGKSVGECIVITPITTRTWFNIKPLLLSIEKGDLDKLIEKEEKLPDVELIELMSKYDKIILEIICSGIHNKKGNMPDWFRQVLLDNCTWEDNYILLNAILFRIGFNPFCKSITTLMNVSPMTEAEIIAAQKNAESWTSQ